MFGTEAHIHTHTIPVAGRFGKGPIEHEKIKGAIKTGRQGKELQRVLCFLRAVGLAKEHGGRRGRGGGGKVCAWGYGERG